MNENYLMVDFIQAQNYFNFGLITLHSKVNISLQMRIKIDDFYLFQKIYSEKTIQEKYAVNVDSI